MLTKLLENVTEKKHQNGIRHELQWMNRNSSKNRVKKSKSIFEEEILSINFPFSHKVLMLF